MICSPTYRPSTPLETISRQHGDTVSTLPADELGAARLPSHLHLLSNENSPISGSPAGDQPLLADVYNPLFPPATSGTLTNDALGRSQPVAFPSYLKIPTLIPSTYASPNPSAPSSPSTSEMKDWPSGESSANVTPHPSAFPTKIGGGGGTAAAAILNTEDVVIKPGGASKASTPTEEEESPISQGAVQIHGSDKGSVGDTSSDSVDGGANGIPSRTPTPTPGNLRGARAMTPTGEVPSAMSTIAPNPNSSVSSGEVAAAAAATSSHLKRAGLNVYTGLESGTNTPGLAHLPIGLTSAPSSALTPKAIPTYNLDGKNTHAAESTAAPLTKATNNLNMTNQNSHAQDKTQGNNRSGGAASQSGGNHAIPSSHVPLMPITVKWRGGGKEVFVTGTFANEWRSKILLKKTAGSGKRAEYSCVLHLAPGTHRLKFIVDDRWRVSRDLSTASDGEGNLTNYIEVAHTGPAHPGPLSAPGEDLLVGEEEEEKKKKGSGPLGIAAHKATLDLMEEARRAEALRRGDLLDVFGNEKVRTEEVWTQQIPESIIKAQIAEELYRNEMAERKPEPKHSRRESTPASNVPVPPTLPRQLEKVILNSSPASVAGAVDDTSVLPAPNHAVLHHLTASAIKSGVIATGCTMRYRKKVSLCKEKKDSSVYAPPFNEFNPHSSSTLVHYYYILSSSQLNKKKGLVIISVHLSCTFPVF